MIGKKKLNLTLIALIYICTCLGQSFINKTISHDGQTRHYDVYVPTIYSGSSNVPLIFNFHGGSGDIASQVAIADMRSIADTAGFIVVYPQALADPNDGGSTNWIHKDPTNVDDVTFVNAMIESLSNEYQIDSNKIYACGYSLGGEFTFELACRLNNKIAAIGVVARTMQNHTFNNCSPVHPTGVLTILGTADAISDYNGVFWGGVQYYLSAAEMHNYWALQNNCDTIPNVSQLPNTNTSDGSSVERHSWSNGDGCIYVEELKVIGGGHDWPGSFGNMDINATEEIWNFVSRYDINGLIGCVSTSINVNNSPQLYLNAYPNPSKGIIQIDICNQNLMGCSINIFNTMGQIIYNTPINTNNILVDISEYGKSGIYYLQVIDSKSQLKGIEMILIN